MTTIGRHAPSLALAALVLLGAAPRTDAQAFGKNGGPTVVNALTSLSGYTIEFTFSLAGTDGYQKLIDFQDLTPDSGLYNHFGNLSFYPRSESSAVITPNTPVDVRITRDSATGLFTGFVNGVQQVQFTDAANEAVFSTNTIRFFQDDAATSGNESGPGYLYSAFVNGKAVAAPEPSQTAALGLGVLGLAGLVLRARRRTA